MIEIFLYRLKSTIYLYVRGLAGHPQRHQQRTDTGWKRGRLQLQPRVSADSAKLWWNQPAPAADELAAALAPG